MNDEFNQWLAQKTNLPHVLAAGLLHPDKTIFSQSFSAEFAEAWFARILLVLTETLQKSQEQKLPDVRVRWSFEHFFIHCTYRHDGSCLAVLTRKEVPPDGAASVEHLLKEFQSL